MTHRKEKPLVCSRSVLPTPPLQDLGKAGEESTAHHQEPYHGKTLAGWCTQWEALQATLHFPRSDL